MWNQILESGIQVTKSTAMTLHLESTTLNPIPFWFPSLTLNAAACHHLRAQIYHLIVIAAILKLMFEYVRRNLDENRIQEVARGTFSGLKQLVYL